MSKISKKIHLVHLTTDSAMGGTERMIAQLSDGINKERFELTVVTLIGGGELEKICAQQNINYKSVNMCSKWDLSAVVRLLFLLRKMDIDILHTYLFHANILGRIIGKIVSVPIIVSGQRNVDLWRRWYHNFLDRMTYRFADKIVSNSKAGRDFLVESVGLKPDNIVTIYNGVDLLNMDKKNGTREKLALTVIASLTLKKGHKYLLEALSRIKDIDFDLFIVGDGSERFFLEQLAGKLGLRDRLFFEGYRKSVDVYLAKTDIFVLPSLWEGLPVALMEAMSCGLPCIATSVGGVAELIEDQKDGLLVEAKNIGQLEKVLRKLMQDENLRVFLGNNAKNKIKIGFSKQKMIGSLENLYTELMENKVV